MNEENSRINSPARARRRLKMEKKIERAKSHLRTTEFKLPPAEKRSSEIRNFPPLLNPVSHYDIYGKDSVFLKPSSRGRLSVSKDGRSEKISSGAGSVTEYLSEPIDESTGAESSMLIPRNKQSQFFFRQNRKITILATLLPDEIISDPNSRKPRPYSTALMFPDVSGFTQLCEKYDKTGKGGPSRLTEVLNGYIGSMINIVLSRNGDICKFGGDAFLCVWKVTEETNIKDIVHLALESAVNIQKNCGEHKTDVGVKLGVKIAVAAGEAAFSIIGSETRKYYVIAGAPVMDVRDAEGICTTGEIIVAPSAWKYVDNYMLYSFTYHSDNKHIKVHDFGPLWKSLKLNSNKDLQYKNPNLNPRPMLKLAGKLEVEDIRPYILPPVMKSIDSNQSLDYLTEMRQVAIVFFNIKNNFRNVTTDEIIDLANEVFQNISSVVDKSDGATNKLTLFDKDMAVLAVFGLKGFKHEIASQVALKCAFTCVELLKNLEIGDVSAGVTTGMAYCGVLGHKLRREYTVIGHPVNLAARLMCAYDNIVSSDRSSFLHSKLDSSHFEVLEQKHLKGLENVGPFYKFNLQPKRKKLKISSTPYFVIGRTREIREFQRILSSIEKSKNETNVLVIFGEPRIGKTCLVAKFISIVDKLNSEKDGQVSRWETNVISLTEDDFKVEFYEAVLQRFKPTSSFGTLRLIFYAPFGLNEESSVEEREDKILSNLESAKDFNFLASLNPIFNVNFDLTPQYMALSKDQLYEVQEKMLRNIYEKCFPKGVKWLIVIEDAECMDEESWNFLRLCWNISPTVLYVITIGHRRPLSGPANEFLEIAQIKKITLGEIEKWFYAKLACQILEVKALPVELINLLQSYKSSGNPGWMESFLQSLIQFESIYITELPLSKVKTMELVTSLTESVKFLGDQPDNENSYWIDYTENLEISDESNFKVPVCLLGVNFYKSNENDTELTMDVMFIKTIDTLKPLQQLILKVGSVLGNNFKRSALKYIISRDSNVEERAFAKAIKNLFDIRILTCAKGDLTQSNVIIPRNMILITSIRKEIVCECNGVVIPAECTDMPHYASCGYMQFKTPTFRDTLYNLLLDEQKKKFHYSCIEYLRNNTFRCNACKNVPFTSVFGVVVNEEVKMTCNITPMHGVRSSKLEPEILPTKSPTEKTPRPFFRYSTVSLPSSQSNFEFDHYAFSKVELRDCHCADILSSVYSVLLEHAAGCGRKDIMLEVQLEYASIGLTSYNIALTNQTLEDALALVNQMKEDKEYPEFCTGYIYGKIYTLMGATKLSMGRREDSLNLLKTALSHMKTRFPNDSTKVNLLIHSELMKHKFLRQIFGKSIGSADDKKASQSDLLSECLGLISTNYIYMGNWQLAKYAAIRALNQALESNRNFFGLCTAYTNLMDVAYHFNDRKTCAKMEIYALEMCKRCSQNVNETFELEAACRLFKVIFQTRFARAEISDAVLIGFQSIKIATIIANSTLRLEMIPDLSLALIQLHRLPEAVSLLQELEFASSVDSDKSSRVWYYALCLDFQLDTGYTVISFDTIQQFVREEEANLLVLRDPNAKHRVLVDLWLWCLRNQEWELARNYARTLKGFNPVGGKETPTTVLTQLKKLEGSLINLVHKMDLKNIYGINTTYNDVNELMHKLNKDLNIVTLLEPRYKLLKAYYKQIRFRDETYIKTLKQAISESEKIGDLNTSQWGTHLKMVWSNAISPFQRDFWIEHSRRNLIDWHECEGDTKTILYSLPLPKF